MKETPLFLTATGEWLTNIDLLKLLVALGADKCEILFIHSSLSFGVPNPQLKKKEILGAIFDVVASLGVKTVCMPTFTFSFPNGKDYNPASSPSKMGALNEYFRKQQGVIRSVDPLMSVALLGEDTALVTDIGHQSCGANSTYDMLHNRTGVKFLFLGTRIGDCMTYMHYLEWLYSVDYRYNRKFVGSVIIDGVETRQEYELFVRYKSVVANSASYTYEQRMYDAGLAYCQQFGNSTISIVGEAQASSAYLQCLQENPYFFVDFVDGRFIKDKTFRLDHEMVAL